MNKIKTNSDGLVLDVWPNTVKLRIRLKSDFLKNTFFGHNFKNAWIHNKFSQELSYINTYMSTNGLSEDFLYNESIFGLFFKFMIFANLYREYMCETRLSDRNAQYRKMHKPQTFQLKATYGH